MENIKTKKCSKCGEEKPMTKEFFNSRKKGSIDGFRNQCKDCRKQYNREYRQNNKEILSQKNKEWIEKNSEHIKERRKKYYILNKENINNKYTKWYQENKEHKLKMNNKRTKERYHIDGFFRMTKVIRTRVSHSIKNKNMSTKDILRCSWKTFKQHIEQQFTEGMDWNNQGKWHYDHIVPISSAKTEEDVYRLNHYTNFQPLWAEDNLKKSDKISEKWGNLSL